MSQSTTFEYVEKDISTERLSKMSNIVMDIRAGSFVDLHVVGRNLVDEVRTAEKTMVVLHDIEIIFEDFYSYEDFLKRMEGK